MNRRRFNDLKEIEGLNETQIKTFKNKYQRDDPTVAATLRRVAHNIALAELVHMPEYQSQVFRDISCWHESAEGSKLNLLHSGVDSICVDDNEIMNDLETIVSKSKKDKEPAERVKKYVEAVHDAVKNTKLEKDSSELRKNFSKFIDNLENLYSSDESARKAVDAAAADFYKAMSEIKFFPNTPTLMNAGRDIQQLSGCYVLSIDDTMDNWGKIVRDTMNIHKSGGGTGFSFSKIRPSGDKVGTTGGVASGPMSMIQIIDKVTEEVKQGGVRRGANMGILDVTHPDVMEFVSYKQFDKNGNRKVPNFNLSVGITESWYKKALAREEYDLINPRNGEVAGKLNAGEVLDKMVECAYKSGDPGVVFLDRLNRPTSNPTPHIGRVESTNPCGEQPLLPNESCNLGSINLSKYITKDESGAPVIDWKNLEQMVKTSVHFLDNVIDMNCYPLQEIEKITKSNRKIGLGVMGWAEMLVDLRIPYNSDKAIETAEELMKFIDNAALKASEELAEKRGAFYNWKGSVYDSDSKYFAGKSARPRNAGRTTIAPTGTIGLAAGVMGGGIEPCMGLATERYTAEGLEEQRQGKLVSDKNRYYQFSEQFLAVAKQANFWGMDEKSLGELIKKNHGSIQKIEGIPKDIRDVFVVAHEIDPEWHVKMQGAFQKYTDHAVSKTVNLRNEATEADIKAVYDFAFKYGCTGVTVFRDGSLPQQVINVSSKSTPEELIFAEPKFQRQKEVHNGTIRQYKAISTANEKRENVYIARAYLSQNWKAEKIEEIYASGKKEKAKQIEDIIREYPDGRLNQIFVNQGKSGNNELAHAEAFGKLISQGLQHGVPPQIYRNTLLGIHSDTLPIKENGDGKGVIYKSIEDATANLIGEYLTKIGEPLEPELLESFYTNNDKEYPYAKEMFKVSDRGRADMVTLVLVNQTNTQDTKSLRAFLHPSKEGTLGEVYFVLGKSGGDDAAHAEALGKLISINLRYGMDPAKIYKTLSGIRSQQGGSMKGRFYSSLEDGIAKEMRKWYLDNLGRDIANSPVSDLTINKTYAQSAPIQATPKQTYSLELVQGLPPCPNTSCRSTSYQKISKGGKGCYVYTCCGYEEGGCQG